MRLLSAALLLSPALSTAGCAYYPQEDGERLHNEVYALLTQMNAVQKSLNDAQQTQAKQDEQVARLSQDVATLNQAARRNDADLGVQLDEMMQQVARMKGQVESSDARLSALESSVNKVSEELDVRFQDIQSRADIEKLHQEEREKAITEARSREKLLGSPKDLFREAERLLRGEKPAEARKLLRELMIRAKDDKKLRGGQSEAQYLIGETFFAEGNYQAAAAEYNGVRKTAPTAPQVPKSLLKLGICFEKLNLAEDAKLFFQTVLQEHPKTPEAKEAKKRLEGLKPAPRRK